MRDLEKQGKENFRDLVICYIIGLQNGEYCNTESEGYKALQELYKVITDRHGKYGQEYRG